MRSDSEKVGSLLAAAVDSHAQCPLQNRFEGRVGFSSNGVTLVFHSTRVVEMIDSAIGKLQSAIALYQIEPVLQFIENWLGGNYDWVPCEVSTVSPDFWIDCVDTAAGVPLTGIFVDPNVHATLPKLPDGYRQIFAIKSALVTATLEVDRLFMDSEDESRLATGALLVLPASFSEPWFGTLCSLASGHADLPVEIDAGRRGIQGHIAVATQATGNSSPESRGVVMSENRQDTSVNHLEVRVQLVESVQVPCLSAAAILVDAVDDRMAVPVSLEGARVLVTVGHSAQAGESRVGAGASTSDSAGIWQATLVRLGRGMGALLDNPPDLSDVR